MPHVSQLPCLHLAHACTRRLRGAEAADRGDGAAHTVVPRGWNTATVVSFLIVKQFGADSCGTCSCVRFAADLPTVSGCLVAPHTFIPPNRCSCTTIWPKPPRRGTLPPLPPTLCHHLCLHKSLPPCTPLPSIAAVRRAGQSHQEGPSGRGLQPPTRAAAGRAARHRQDHVRSVRSSVVLLHPCLPGLGLCWCWRARTAPARPHAHGKRCCNALLWDAMHHFGLSVLG